MNGPREIDMILDTGMPIHGAVFLDPKIGEEIGLEYSGKVNIGGPGSGEGQTANSASGIKISLSDIEFEDQNVLVLTEKQKFLTSVVEGIIGKLIFDVFVVEIDFENSLLKLHDPAIFQTKNIGTEIPL